MSKQFENFIEEAKAENFLILDAQVRKNGEVIDHWHKFPAQPRFETYSVSKTFTGLAVGIAIEEGLLTLDEKLVDSFPEESYDVTNQNGLDITVKDLLTMTSGISETMLWRDGPERRHKRDWVRYFYTDSKFDNKPGTEFLYNNINSYMLSALIEKKSGQSLVEYLRYRLFEPIGIHNPEWVGDPMGRTVAANGLVINADEMGRFGQLIANGGEYNGKRIVSEEFIKDMTSSHITETGEYIPGEKTTDAGYGYQTWIDEEHNAVYAWGIFGQYCIILPEKDIVVSVIALDDRDGGSNGIYDTSEVRKLIWDNLITQF